jgi:catechol 2,3-dioxygenase-like lactoylglutathione lyase family enzyme
MSVLAESRIGQVAIVCKDVARATAFYRDVLGLRFLFAAGPALSFFQCGDVRLMLSPAEGEANGTSVLYYFVSDIEGKAKALADKGVPKLGEPHLIARMPDHELWLAEFRDSEGNVCALMEEKREGGRGKREEGG